MAERGRKKRKEEVVEGGRRKEKEGEIRSTGSLCKLQLTARAEQKARTSEFHLESPIWNTWVPVLEPHSTTLPGKPAELHQTQNSWD